MTTVDVETRDAMDPATSPARLAEVLSIRPDLAALVAQHPNAYPELLSWIAQHADPAAQAVAISRLTQPAMTAPGVLAAAQAPGPSGPENGAAPSAQPSVAPRGARTRLIWVISAAATAVILAVAGWYVVGSGVLPFGGDAQATYIAKMSQPRKVWQVDVKSIGASGDRGFIPREPVGQAGLLVQAYSLDAPEDGTANVYAVISTVDGKVLWTRSAAACASIEDKVRCGDKTDVVDLDGMTGKLLAKYPGTGAVFGVQSTGRNATREYRLKDEASAAQVTADSPITIVSRTADGTETWSVAGTGWGDQGAFVFAVDQFEWFGQRGPRYAPDSGKILADPGDNSYSSYRGVPKVMLTWIGEDKENPRSVSGTVTLANDQGAVISRLEGQAGTFGRVLDSKLALVQTADADGVTHLFNITGKHLSDDTASSTLAAQCAGVAIINTPVAANRSTYRAVDEAGKHLWSTTRTYSSSDQPGFADVENVGWREVSGCDGENIVLPSVTAKGKALTALNLRTGAQVWEIAVPDGSSLSALPGGALLWQLKTLSFYAD